MEPCSSIRTYRWTRSPRGEVFGVATGLAEWRGLPPNLTRLVVFISCFCTSGVILVLYLLAALILPIQKESDIISYEGGPTPFDKFSSKEKKAYASYSSSSNRETRKTNEELRKEYEELKKKVETMESEMMDKEKDWDERFKGEDL